MAFSFTDFRRLLIDQLTDDERSGAVAYAAETPLAAGTHLELPGTSIDVVGESYVGFIDRDPTANWGHAARYVIMDVASGAVNSKSARLPPFRSRTGLAWRLVYKAPSVPEAAVEKLS